MPSRGRGGEGRGGGGAVPHDARQTVRRYPAVTRAALQDGRRRGVLAGRRRALRGWRRVGSPRGARSRGRRGSADALGHDLPDLRLRAGAMSHALGRCEWGMGANGAGHGARCAALGAFIAKMVHALPAPAGEAIDAGARVALEELSAEICGRLRDWFATTSGRNLAVEKKDAEKKEKKRKRRITTRSKGMRMGRRADGFRERATRPSRARSCRCTCRRRPSWRFATIATSSTASTGDRTSSPPTPHRSSPSSPRSSTSIRRTTRLRVRRTTTGPVRSRGGQVEGHRRGGRRSAARRPARQSRRAAPAGVSDPDAIDEARALVDVCAACAGSRRRTPDRRRGA